MGAGVADPDRVLVVDDSPATIEVIRRNLERRGLRVVTAGTVADALEVLESAPVDLVVTDMKMPGASGLELIRHVRDNHPSTEIVMITGYPSVSSAIEAVKSGAEEYLAKPFTEGELFAVVDRALAKLRMRAASALESPTQWEYHGLIGASTAIQRVFCAIHEIAAHSRPVLITGEYGTGRESIARAIHYTSTRSSAPFVVVSCAGIPGDRLGKELFGEAGAAVTVGSGLGLFEMADGGTVFLDEIAEIGPEVQSRLLHLLREELVSTSNAGVRLVAATDRDPQVLHSSDRLDRDLLLTLGSTTIPVPPLRDRGEDIIRLCLHFAARYAAERGMTAPHFTERVLTVLCRHPWPGNLRELERVVRGLVVAADGGMVDTPDLPDPMRFSAAREVGVDRTLADVEGDFIRQVLARVDGNKSRAARILGIDRKTLRLKLRKMGSH